MADEKLAQGPRALFERIRADSKSVLDEWLDEKVRESVRLEFKEKTDRSKAALDDGDASTLSRAISALANTSGGLVGFGFKTDKTPKGEPDRLEELKPIADVSKCVGQIANHLHDWVEPPVAGLDVHPIATGSNGEGVVVVYVPASDGGPHRVAANGQHRDRYYMRTSSSSVVMPHGMLGALFGRRPEPHVRVIAHLDANGITIRVRNDGRGVARGLAVSLENLTNDFDWPQGSKSGSWEVRHRRGGLLFLLHGSPLFPQLDETVVRAKRLLPTMRASTLQGVTGVTTLGQPSAITAGHPDARYLLTAGVFTDGRPRRYSGEVADTGTDVELAELGSGEDEL